MFRIFFFLQKFFLGSARGVTDFATNAHSSFDLNEIALTLMTTSAFEMTSDAIARVCRENKQCVVIF